MGLELVKREKSFESIQVLRRNWNKLDNDHLLLELNSFLQKTFESVSGQLLTSDTNRCAEIVHEKLVEALNTFVPLKPSNQGAKKDWIDRKVKKFSSKKKPTLEALLTKKIPK